jgi:hypothetical protein
MPMVPLHLIDAFHHTYQQYFIAPEAPLPVPIQSEGHGAGKQLF